MRPFSVVDAFSDLPQAESKTAFFATVTAAEFVMRGFCRCFVASANKI
jgi:hypothetical protein